MPAATLGWLIPGVLGAAGLGMQAHANSQSQSMANQELALQMQQIQQQQAQEFAYQQAVGQEAEQGLFSPEAAVKQANLDRDYQAKQETGNIASGARILGYRPGDTVPGQAMNAAGQEYNLAAAQQDAQIRQQAGANYLAAMAGQLPNATGAGINALGEDYRTALGQYSPLGGILQNLAPYLTQAFSSSGPGTASPLQTSPSGGTMGNTGYGRGYEGAGTAPQVSQLAQNIPAPPANAASDAVGSTLTPTTQRKVGPYGWKSNLGASFE